jgi:hypothetical protein
MFTYDDFRATQGLREEVARFLRSDVGRVFMRVMRQKYTPYDVPAGADALVSARILAQFHGAHTCLDDIEKICVPLGHDEMLESSFEAPETDHDQLPSEDARRPIVRIPTGIVISPKPEEPPEN